MHKWLNEKACTEKPQVGFCKGKAHNDARLNPMAPSQPKGNSSREYKASLNIREVYCREVKPFLFNFAIFDGSQEAVSGSTRPTRLAIAAISSLGSIGLAKCKLNPALRAAVRSSARAKAVTAMAGIRPP